MKKVIFTDEQIKYIKDNVGKLSMKEISRNLDISYRVISNYVNKVMKVDSKHTFNDVEDFVIKKYYGEKPTGWIAQQLNLKVETVYNRARRLGVAKKANGTLSDSAL